MRTVLASVGCGVRALLADGVTWSAAAASCPSDGWAWSALTGADASPSARARRQMPCRTPGRLDRVGGRASPTFVPWPPHGSPSDSYLVAAAVARGPTSPEISGPGDRRAGA